MTFTAYLQYEYYDVPWTLHCPRNYSYSIICTLQANISMYWLAVTALCGSWTAHHRVLCLTYLCCQCHCCLLIIISVSCLLFIYMQQVCSTIKLISDLTQNHQRTRQLSASFAYYTPHVSITLLSSGRYHSVYLLTYL